MIVGCHPAPGSGPSAVNPEPALAVTSAKPAAGQPGTTPHAGTSASQQTRSEFDGDRAYRLLKQQCDFGVRPLGTDAHEKCKEFLLAEMKKYADTTVTQLFRYHGMPVTNIVGVIYPAGATRAAAYPVVLMAHWDTRPIADGPFSSHKADGYRYGPRGWNRTNPIMGADDGASGAAILLELARVLKKNRPPVGVLLVLDDGEDYGDFLAQGQSGNPQGDGVELGSRYFALHFRETKEFGQPSYGILLDMVGAKGAFFPRERQSQARAQTSNDKVFGTAESLGYGKVFRSNEAQEVNDDHIAVNDAGIPMIDIIHPLPYPPYDLTGYRYWHTLQDTPDKCGAQTLKVVGDVVNEVLGREQPETASR
jgi:hypothetical protein